MKTLQACIKFTSVNSPTFPQLWIYLFQSALDQTVHQGAGCYFKAIPTWKRTFLF